MGGMLNVLYDGVEWGMGMGWHEVWVEMLEEVSDRVFA